MATAAFPWWACRTNKMSHDHSANFELASQAGPVPDHQEPAVVVGSGVWLAVSFGGGVNSTAMLCGMGEREIRPSIITFADTGSEMPQTYEHLTAMRAQTQAWWGLDIITVRKLREGKFEGLEHECLRGAKLPALAYGSRACSVKYKHEPQNRLLCTMLKQQGKTWPRVPSKKRLEKMGLTQMEWATQYAPRPRASVRAIGFDAGEPWRQKPSPDPWADNWYPLVEWGWQRAACVETIRRHGLPMPGKSACFFCPASKRREVLRLRDTHPDLLARALEMERRAQTGANRQVRGLGGENNLWADWLKQDHDQSKLWLDIEPMHAPCGCYDGG